MKHVVDFTDQDLQLIVSAINGFTEAVKEAVRSADSSVVLLLDRIGSLSDEVKTVRKLLTSRKIVNTISLEPKVSHD